MVEPIYNQVEKPLYRGTQIVWYIFYFIETLLLFRFILKLIGANPDAGFTQFIYGFSNFFMMPFLYVVRSPSALGSTIEFSTIIALIVYWVVAWGIVRLIVMGKPVSHVEAHVKLENQDIKT